MTRSTLQVLRKQRLLSLRQFPCASGKRELGQANCKPNGCQIDIASLGERIVVKNYDEGEYMLHLQLPSLDASFLVVLCQNNARQGGGGEVAIT